MGDASSATDPDDDVNESMVPVRIDWVSVEGHGLLDTRFGSVRLVPSGWVTLPFFDGASESSSFIFLRLALS